LFVFEGFITGNLLNHALLDCLVFTAFQAHQIFKFSVSLCIRLSNSKHCRL